MKNNKIYKGMLRDEKHLNQEGFFTFLANIKFVLFGEIPVVSGKNINIVAETIAQIKITNLTHGRNQQLRLLFIFSCIYTSYRITVP